MVNLTNDEWKQLQLPLDEPKPGAKEYGHRGRITAEAIKQEKIEAEADEWIAGAPVDGIKDKR